MKNALGRVDSVLLLGGRSEIGLAIVRRLVRHSAPGGARRVVLAAREGASNEEAVAAVKAAGADVVEALSFDGVRPETHEDFVRAAFERLGGDADVVISAFGVLGEQDAYERDPVAAADSVTANFTGHLSAGLHVGRRLREQGHGTFVVLSSVAGVRVRKANYVYGSAKAGLDGFAQGLGDALHGSGAKVMVVRPGFVRTKMTEGMPPGPFSVTADEVAGAVETGLRLGRETVWVPAKLQAVFTAMRLLPRPVWRRMPM
ncbi:MAG: decaprenylphospho-beta-D-erythro-pentofuranosid-2-ulose 2-reductase [Streptosporangiaceae bacterium]